MKRRGRKVRGRKPYRKSGLGGYHAPHRFTEMIKLRDIVSPTYTTAANNPYNNSITGSAIENLSGSLLDVFKLYTVTGIKLVYIPAYNTYPLVAGTAFIPRIFFAEDKADISTPSAISGISALMQQDNCKIFDSSKKWTHYISRPRPYYKVNNSAYNPAPTTQIMPSSRQLEWCSTSDPFDQENSGLFVEWLNSVMCVQANNSAVDVTTGSLYARVFYSCKEQK